MTKQISVHAEEELIEKWESEIDEEYDNKSIYYRQMIESGRRELGLADTYDKEDGEESGTNDEPRVPNLEYHIRQQLDTDTSKPRDDIVNGVVEDIGEDVEEVLNDLVVAGDVRYKNGGFILTSLK